MPTDNGLSTLGERSGIDRRRFLRNLGATGVAVPGGGALLAACTGEGDEAGAEDSNRSGITIEYPQVDAANTFFRVIVNGAEQGGRDLGVEVNVRTTPTFDIVEQARLIEAAIITKPSGIITVLYDPDALGPPVEKAVEAGIAVILIDGAFDAKGNIIAEELGALTYIGLDELESGIGSGRRMTDAGVQRTLIVNHDPTQLPIKQRERGFQEGFAGETETVVVPFDDETVAKNRVEALLRAEEFDGVFGLSASAGTAPAVRAIQAVGQAQETTVATFDLDAQVVDQLQSEELLFAVDAQQYLQGYLGVLYLTLAEQYDFRPATEFTPAGPNFVTAEQVTSELVEHVKAGIR